ncbi:hypothetical protein QFC22_000113 [Naganishia vaughanmartiniae]|uniref:Uncharacterized protein n=1 Tax=Naganishia vaughanmartiniae TaxID=1424756 RepID=A0ACC2XP70_9TREE|nr:hypothetical protein QFC22_000113 [Naganishia vaughanmartiniae]
MSSQTGRSKGTVMVSGGRMAKGLTLARAFKRAGWTVIGVEEVGWGELCPMRFSSAVDSFHIVPSPTTDFPAYSRTLISLAIEHHVDLFLPVCGAGSTVEDAKAAQEMSAKTNGRCKTFIQDPETVLDLHDKDRFQNLVEELGFAVPIGKLVHSVDEAITFLKEVRQDEQGNEVGYIIKCTELDENRGDLTTFPLLGDDQNLTKTRKHFDELKLKMSRKYPYVIQEFIPGQEWCTHASVVEGQVTAFVTCPSNDMLMTYENWTQKEVGRRAEKWTIDFLNKLSKKPMSDGKQRHLNGHFSFDFILSTRNGEMYPIECNPRVHTAIILLPLSSLAACYPTPGTSAYNKILRPDPQVLPRTWLYNDIVMRLLPYILPFPEVLDVIHPSLSACCLSWEQRRSLLPDESPFRVRVDPTLVADDPLPFLVLWHVWWPSMLLKRWWQGKNWTRINVSTGRIFEA